MADLKAEFHEQLGVEYDEEVSICLLESVLKMSKSHAEVLRMCLTCP